LESKGARQNMRRAYREAVPKTKYKYEIIVQGEEADFGPIEATTSMTPPGKLASFSPIGACGALRDR